MLKSAGFFMQHFFFFQAPKNKRIFTWSKQEPKMLKSAGFEKAFIYFFINFLPIHD